MRSLPVRIVPSRQSIQALPAEGRPGPSENNDDDGNDDDDDDCGVKMIMAASAMESGAQLGPGSLHTLLWWPC